MKNVRRDLLDQLDDGDLRREVEFEPKTLILSANDVRMLRESVIANICYLEEGVARRDVGWEFYRAEITALRDVLDVLEMRG